MNDENEFETDSTVDAMPLLEGAYLGLMIDSPGGHVWMDLQSFENNLTMLTTNQYDVTLTRSANSDSRKAFRNKARVIGDLAIFASIRCQLDNFATSHNVSLRSLLGALITMAFNNATEDGFIVTDPQFLVDLTMRGNLNDLTNLEEEFYGEELIKRYNQLGLTAYEVTPSYIPNYAHEFASSANYIRDEDTITSMIWTLAVIKSRVAHIILELNPVNPASGRRWEMPPPSMWISRTAEPISGCHKQLYELMEQISFLLFYRAMISRKNTPGTIPRGTATVGGLADLVVDAGIPLSDSVRTFLELHPKLSSPSSVGIRRGNLSLSNRPDLEYELMSGFDVQLRISLPRFLLFIGELNDLMFSFWARPIHMQEQFPDVSGEQGTYLESRLWSLLCGSIRSDIVSRSVWLNQLIATAGEEGVETILDSVDSEDLHTQWMAQMTFLNTVFMTKMTQSRGEMKGNALKHIQEKDCPQRLMTSILADRDWTPENVLTYREEE